MRVSWVVGASPGECSRGDRAPLAEGLWFDLGPDYQFRSVISKSGQLQESQIARPTEPISPLVSRPPLACVARARDLSLVTGRRRGIHLSFFKS